MNRFIFLIIFWATTSLQAAPVTLELIGGSKLTGEVLKWDGKEVIFKAEMGVVKLRKEQLSERTLQSLTPSAAPTASDSDRIRELEATIESLRRDNAALRQQLQDRATSGATMPVTTGQTGFARQQSSSEGSAGGYWISSTGKRHNSNCRYYRTSKGGSGNANQGVACKICGG